VVHRHDDRLLRIPVHDPFQTNFLSSHSKQQLHPLTLLSKQTRGITSIPVIKPVIKRKCKKAETCGKGS
jgi:hypothetical protein